MPQPNWTAIAAEVAEAIAEVGYSATLIKPPAASGPAYDPTWGTPAEVAITVMEDSAMIGDRPRSVEFLGRRTLVIATGTGIAVEHGDKIKIGSEQPHDIADGGIRPLAPGGTILLWEVDLAR